MPRGSRTGHSALGSLRGSCLVAHSDVCLPTFQMSLNDTFLEPLGLAWALGLLRSLVWARMTVLELRGPAGRDHLRWRTALVSWHPWEQSSHHSILPGPLQPL